MTVLQLSGEDIHQAFNASAPGWFTQRTWDEIDSSTQRTYEFMAGVLNMRLKERRQEKPLIAIRLEGGNISDVVSEEAGVVYRRIDLDNHAVGEEDVSDEIAEVVSDIEVYTMRCLGEEEFPKLKLREALESASRTGCVTPGAIYKNSYVYYDEEMHGTMDRPWHYIPDVESPKADHYHLLDEQLEGVVLFAEESVWEPTSNLVI